MALGNANAILAPPVVSVAFAVVGRRDRDHVVIAATVGIVVDLDTGGRDSQSVEVDNPR